MKTLLVDDSNDIWIVGLHRRRTSEADIKPRNEKITKENMIIDKLIELAAPQQVTGELLNDEVGY